VYRKASNLRTELSKKTTGAAEDAALGDEESEGKETMRWREIDGRYVVKLDVGDEVVESLKRFAAEKGMRSGVVWGIGGIEGVVLGYYDLDAQKYLRKEIPGRLELVTLMGNISMLDGEVFVHGHAVVSGSDMGCYAGHLFSATVAVTAEFYLWGSQSTVTRSRDDAVGLNTLDL
jgi:predicted DNA-binding protein with PD1-like motif